MKSSGKKIDENYILTGNIFKGLLNLALPIMLLNFINTVYTLTDTYFVGKISELAVGAVSLVSPIVNCGNACIVGLSSATVALVSRALGEQNRDKANRAVKHIFIIGCVISVLFGFLLIFFKDPILLWLETPEEIYEDTGNYMLGIAFDFLFLFIILFFQAVKQSCGDAKSGVRLNILACILNCLIDPIFISVLDMGTLGAALATLISKAVVSPIAIVFLFKKDQSVYLENVLTGYEKDTFVTVIKLAVPSALGQFLASFGFVLMSKEIVSYGALIMSAYGIGNQITSLFNIPLYGISSALTTYIGQSLGANNQKRAKESYKKAMLVTAIAALILTALGFLTVPYAIDLFIKNASEQLIKEALIYSYFSIFTSFCMGWFVNLLAIFNGSGNTTISMIISASRLFVIRIPLIYIFAKYTTLMHMGIWLAMVVSNLVNCIIGQVLYMVYPWTKRGVKM